MDNTIAKQAGTKKQRIATYLLCCFAIILQWLSVELSISDLSAINNRIAGSNILGISIIAVFNLVLLMLIGRKNLTLFITSTICSVFSFMNIFVLALHGSPIRASELGNIGTALQVLGGYTLSISKKQLIIIVLFIVELLASYLLKRLENGDKPNRLRIAAAFFAMMIVAAVLWNNPQFTPIIGFSWSFSADMYGYTPCLVKDAMIFAAKVEKPDGYSESELDRIDNNLPAAENDNLESLPDIILILNESFYDPAVFKEIELKTDKDYLQYYHSLPDNNRAQVAVPYTGTNSTEYELLTSNSKRLINPSAPFVYFDLSDANSIVRYLKTLGYDTWAMHNAEPENYNRKEAYKDLGFDHILFCEDMLPDEVYGNRRGTDLNDYGDLIKAYEEADPGPRFIYMLTIQNHGGYEQNPSDMDKIHCMNDYREYTDDMDEFLTSISMSDEAFAYLIDYYSKVDRKVIIAVLGDHPPTFVFSWSNDTLSQDSNEKEYVKRNTTPLLLWNNFSEEGSNYEYVTASDIVPMVLEIGGIPLSDYYRQILKVQAETPVHLGDYILDPDDKLLREEELNDYAIKDYLLMEYNNLQNNRRQEWFEPQ